MSKILSSSVLILVIFLAACSSISTHDDDETAATVKGQEITIGDLRFLYPDDTALDYLDWQIRVELVKQKVNEMGLDILDKLREQRDGGWFGNLPPKDTKDEGGKQIRRFAESQANKLGMEPEEFQREYAKRINKQNAYITTYLEDKLGEAKLNNKEWMEESHEKVEKLLTELVEENEDGIEVLIK